MVMVKECKGQLTFIHTLNGKYLEEVAESPWKLRPSVGRGEKCVLVFHTFPLNKTYSFLRLVYVGTVSVLVQGHHDFHLTRDRQWICHTSVILYKCLI